MLRKQTLFVAAAISALQAASSASATELDGAWVSVTNRSHCARIFHASGSGIVVREPGGFVIAGNIIKGRLTSCLIVKKSETGDTVQLLATCSHDIFQNQIILRIDNQNQITRLFPDMPDNNTSYFRCTRIGKQS